MMQKISMEELCMKLRPIFGKKIDEIYLKYTLANNSEERAEIEHIINILYYKNLSKLLDEKVFLEPPVKEAVNGEYPLAMVSYADKRLFPFALREQDWIRHVCISGMSGSGKTTLAFHILNNFIKKDKPFLVFDWKKSFRPLVLIDPEIMCFTIGKDSVSNLFKMNINEPPKGVSPKEWINVLCDLLTESFFVSYGVHKILLETLDDAFKEWGIYHGSENYPTWNHIKWKLEEKLNKAKGREAGWLESALRIASVLTFGDFGKICNYKGEGEFKVEDLLNKKVIFELNSLGNIEKKFFCEFILTYIYKLKKARQSFTHENFDHAIIVDEAHNIFLKEDTHFTKESVTDMIYRELREYGTSLICLDQHISKLSDTVKGNSACHIAFQQQLPQDTYDISGIMQLKERKNFFSMLPVGTAIVKLSERYTSPFLVEVLPVKLREEEVTDKNIQDRMKCIMMGREIENGNDKEFTDALVGESVKIKEDSLSNPNPQSHPNNFIDATLVKSLAHPLLKNINQLTNFSNEIAHLPLKDVNKLIYPSQKLSASSNEIELTPQKNKQEIEFKLGNILGKSILKNIDLSEIRKEPVEQISVNLPLKQNIAQNLNEDKLTSKQKVLYEFVDKKIGEGISLNKIERFLEFYVRERAYTSEDVLIVINYSLEKQFEDLRKIAEPDVYGNDNSVTTLKKQNIYKEQKSIEKIENNQDKCLSKEQKMFLSFLQENPGHDCSTVELYRKIGLSPRKGNKIKIELLQKSLIKIQEQKNDKGWKKLIRLN